MLASAFERNLVVCIENHNAKDFITLKLITEIAPELRSSKRPQIVLYILNDFRKADQVSFLGHLTDLRVAIVEPKDEEIPNGNHIIISDSLTVLKHLQSGSLSAEQICLIVLDDCHLQIGRSHMEPIVEQLYSVAQRKPKILGISDSLYGSNCPSDQLEAKLQYLEQCLRSTIVTACEANNNTGRLAEKPLEFLLQNGTPSLDALTSMIIELVQSNISFLNDHRFDPLEIYSDEFVDDWKNVADPKLLPLSLLYEFLDILLDLGPFTAKKAALHFIVQIEKFKIKTAYERHFLLLSLASSVFHQVRMLCDYFMRNASFKDRITTYTTPKVQHLLSALKQFQPKTPAAITDKSPPETNCTNGPTVDAAPKPEITELDSLKIRELITLIEDIQDKTSESTEANDCSEIKATLEGLTINPTASVVSSKPPTTTAVSSKPTATEQRPPRTKKRFFNRHRGFHNNQNQDSDSLCGLVLCDSKNVAKALFSVVHEAAMNDPELKFLSVQYTTEKCQSVDVVAELKEVEAEHRKQEEVLKRFRSRECNLLISTSMLESGIDLPKCNLVVRWNVPKSYRSYVLTKGKANSQNAVHLIMVSPVFVKESVPFEKFSTDYHDFVCSATPPDDIVDVPVPEDGNGKAVERYIMNAERITAEVTEQLAEYFEVEKILARNRQKPNERLVREVESAEVYSNLVAPYKATQTSPCSATLLNSIHLINNYCAKLPSDTFTKLVPLVRYTQTRRHHGLILHQCTIRLPINSSLKSDIVGPPAPKMGLAGRLAALVACKMLHRSGELDDNLQPIGKEEFRAAEVYFKNFELDQADHQLVKENAEPRPGTTKRRQYYYKKVAATLKDCRPVVGVRVYLYHIRMVLRTPIPEEQNTRGRRIFAPEDCPLGFGILTTKRIPKLCSFPIFTRSGEIEVSLELIDDNIRLNDTDILKINHFIRFTFTNVLRLQKYLMFFDESATENCLYIVPTVEDLQTRRVQIDQTFLELIYNQPSNISKFKTDEERKDWTFDEDAFQDAVVMPWYRNQDQPQFFYVAEICKFLSPESSFPGTSYATFKEYYYKKYNIDVQNTSQPLLDVDHTSARLNFLTPRYVNRKGVALPTSSEETKRAKRENLEQKQILIPELCRIHPFPASLWRAAVCLPCILYRINALLLADEIRIVVAEDLGLGQLVFAEKEWPILNFGWSLHEMLKIQGGDKRVAAEEEAMQVAEKNTLEIVLHEPNKEDDVLSGSQPEDDDIKEVDGDQLEIGTWNNEMAKNLYDGKDMDLDKIIRYGSPTQWDRSQATGEEKMTYLFDSDSSFQSDDEDDNRCNPVNVETFDPQDDMRLRIKFESNNVAEAFESEATIANWNKYYHQLEYPQEDTDQPFDINQIEGSPHFKAELLAEFEKKKREMVERVKERHLIASDQPLDLINCRAVKKNDEKRRPSDLLCELFPYLTAPEIKQYLEQNGLDVGDPKLTTDHWFDLNELYFKLHPSEKELFTVSSCGDGFDRFEGSGRATNSLGGDREICVQFTRGNVGKRNFRRAEPELTFETFKELHKASKDHSATEFSFDYQPNLIEHPGPSPSIILQALTMSNANDGINLERLETIGDSFLKFAITTYLYCTYEHVHEGKLSHLRSKYVSNLNLYRLGRLKRLGELMISTKFEPHDNWLPPCYYTPKGLEKVLIEAHIPIFFWNLADLCSLKEKTNYEICALIMNRAVENGFVPQVKLRPVDQEESESGGAVSEEASPCFIPYNLVNQHSIPDKSIADCVEALIGSYLIDCGPRGALLFMSWIGICVLPHSEIEYPADWVRYPGSGPLIEQGGKTYRRVYGSWQAPKSPSCEEQGRSHAFDYESEGFRSFEMEIGYTFNDPLYLLQAMTHASYSPNRLTDCYQRLEFLGDAVLDYLITRHLFEDPRQHSPGALTDLRSALVNNTIFASLAVRHGFHKHFRHLSAGLHQVIDRFVRIQHENGYTLSEEVRGIGLLHNGINNHVRCLHCSAT